LDGRDLDAHYLGYFECFNRQLFYEAHSVLEQLWLPQRGGPDGAFYKGLIQLAGAFVHLQKGRVQPAAALFRLAQDNLRAYPPIHHLLDLRTVLALIREWRNKVESAEFKAEPFTADTAPKLELLKR
jgi:predicted metal-dependent hydrolase